MSLLLTWGLGSPAFAPAPAGSPDFLAALVAYWAAQPALVAVAPQLYYDELPEEGATPYAILSLVGSVPQDRNTGRVFAESDLYQFALYADTQDAAVSLGQQMRTALDAIQDATVPFADGTKRGWFWAGKRLMKVPGRGPAGTMVWQQSHTYRATIGKTR